MFSTQVAMSSHHAAIYLETHFERAATPPETGKAPPGAGPPVPERGWRADLARPLPVRSPWLAHPLTGHHGRVCVAVPVLAGHLPRYLEQNAPP